ncbi:MAG: hypothetical protein H6772_04335 [Pseudomonadales bacterium]|nr:hypothetical protein [Pseudomonadales bacterium]
MKKEVLIAIFVGLSMGLIITFGFYRVRTSITDTPTTDLTQDITTGLETAKPTMLALHSPEDGLIQTENELTVTGTTTPNSFIVLFVNDEDFISNTDDSGNFSFKIELNDGPNILRIHVLDESGETTVEERLVVVSDELEKAENQALDLTTETKDSDATPSAN